MIERKALVRQLLEAAKLLEVLDRDRFRARAYANAARGLDAFEGDLNVLAEEGSLTRIKGIGSGLAAELTREPIEGTLPALAELRSEVPAGVRELFRISGLGASKVRTLWQAGIDSPTALLDGIEKGEVQALKGFGQKSAETFREGARFLLEAKARMRRDEAEAVLAEVVWSVQERFPEAPVIPVGEVRRGCETVGGVEVVVVGVPAAELQAFSRERFVDQPVTLHAAASRAAGAALVAYTGSEAYLAGLRDRAGARGLELRAEGLFRGDTQIEAPTEAEVFAALGLSEVAPELREEPGAQPVEDLITLTDLRGLVHNHSTWSDAEHSIRQMVAAARRAGYAYLALADHSRSSYYAGGLTAERVRRQADEVRAIRAELATEGAEFSLLHGIEVDILPDGSLDYEDDVLELLDYTVVSVHQQFTLGREEQTRRMVAAVRHPHADILGHATGRLLLQRPEYDVDLEAVIEACAETGTVIEINANPRRLDLDWRWAKFAKARGCRFSIDPDAHHVDGYADLAYGVSVARKAGLTRADVVNTAPTADGFLAQLKRSAGPR